VAVAMTFAIVAFAPGLNVWPVCFQLYFVAAMWLLNESRWPQ